MDVKEVIVKPKSKKIKKKNINDPTSNFETKKDFFVYLDDIQQNNPILFKKITAALKHQVGHLALAIKMAEQKYR